MPVRQPLPVHPGEIQLKEFLTPLKISPDRFAREVSVPPLRIDRIVRGLRSISADTALRFTRHFGTSAQPWLNLQTRYDLEAARDRLGDRLQREVKVFAEESVTSEGPQVNDSEDW